MLEKIATGVKIAGGVTSILGSLGVGKKGSGPNSPNKQYDAKRRYIRHGGKDIRKGAEAAGFHPLTYLNAMSGTPMAMPGQPAQPMLASIGASIGDIGSALDDLQAARDAAQILAMRQAEHDAEMAENAETAGGTVPTEREVRHDAPSPVVRRETGRPSGPELRPSLATVQRQPQLHPTNGVVMLPVEHAARLKLEPWELMAAEDDEFALGEFATLGHMTQPNAYSGAAGYWHFGERVTPPKLPELDDQGRNPGRVYER